LDFLVIAGLQSDAVQLSVRYTPGGVLASPYRARNPTPLEA